MRVLTLLLIALLVGCSATSSVSPDAPEGAQVVELERTRDPHLPVYVLLLDPISGRSEKVDGYCERYPGPHILMNAALINSLSKSGNFSIIDPSRNHVRRVKLRSNEQGPFIIRVSPAEVQHQVERNERGVDSKIDKDDGLLTTLGKVTLMIPSFWITQATGLPTSWTDKEAKGLVTLDVSVVDARTGTIVTSFPASGSFSVKSREVGNRMSGYYSNEAVASPMESALRIAMNQAAVRLLKELSDKYPK